MSLIQKISNTKDFSHTEREIADYILNHSDDIIHMTIEDLVRETYTSNASIIRFCKKIGMQGYREFKITFIQELEKRRNDNTYVDYNYPFHQDDSTNDILNHIAKLTNSTIDICYKNINAKKIHKIAEIISNSQNVYSYAIGDSLIRAMSFQNKLLKIGKHLINTSALRDETAYTTHTTNKDCAIFITYSASSSSQLHDAQILKKHGTKIIIITSNEESALTRLADYSLIIPNLENKFDSIATFYSQIAFEYVLNVIYSIIYGIQYSENHKRKFNVSLNQKKNSN